MPAQLGDWRLTDAEVIRGTGAGGRYRFTDGSAARVSVIVYAVSDDAMNEPTPQGRVEHEGRKSQTVLDLLTQNGTYDGVGMAFAGADTVVANGVAVPGFSSAAAAKRNGRISVELQYLYLVGSRFLKVRATLPERDWERSTVPGFAKTLARVVAGG